MKRRFWTSDWFVGFLLTVAFFVAADSRPMNALDEVAYDLVASLSGSTVSGADVAVVGIGADSLKRYGPWPWPRDTIADLLQQLDAAQAVGVMLPLERPQYVHALARIEALQSAFKGRRHAREAEAVLQRVHSSFDTDARLAAALHAGNVLLSTDTPARPAGPRPFTARLPSPLAAPPAAVAPPVLWQSFAASHSAPLGLAQTARAVPLAVTGTGADHHLQPTFTAALVARSAGVNPDKLEFVPHRPVKVGFLSLNTDRGFRFYPRYTASVPVYPFTRVMHDPKLRRSLRRHTVLVGLTAPGLTRPVQLPGGETVPPVVATARAVASALAGESYRIPGWALWAQFGVLAAVGLALMLVLPRFRQGTALLLTVLLVFALFNAHFVMMSTYGIWVPLMVPAALLLSGFLVLSIKHGIRDRFEAVRLDLSSANRQLGLALHSQGQLDQAFEKYRSCLVDEPLLEQMYNLGLDYERKRRFNRAASLFSHMARCRHDFRDVAERAKRNREMENRVVLGQSGAASASGTIIMDVADGLQKPMLGRYQVERELGRGAMGLVYLGRDPKIGRTVAIKTMALSQEFDDEQLGEVTERFFREAETAGRLDHPNIVTVYDVGEEQELAYIAMDYLKGTPLSAFCKPDQLLEVDEALEVAAQVADALDYAHGKGVIHRDIKPANIVYDPDSGNVKVTDFGVACLTDSSKTKTGTVLGSPSYMSPEQFAGNRVDGRSDLFSLGITLYQLLSGQLPFTGDSFATLMYRIANEKHVDIRKVRADLPTCASRIINKALQKEAERRYESGAKFAEALRRCKEA